MGISIKISALSMGWERDDETQTKDGWGIIS